MHRLASLAFLLLAAGMALGAVWPSRAAAAGPWKAQVVDAETGTSLEGVVVLFYWIKDTASWGGWAGGEFYHAEEVVTSPDGRFVMPARSTWTLLPWKRISREIVIFKPGYGQWRFHGYDEWRKLSLEEQEARLQAAWKQFEGDGVVIALPPLKTHEERRSFLHRAGPSALVPRELTKRLEGAIDQERIYLGLPPMYRGKP
ncbi:MAG: hypothetical protein AAB253_00360 [candidate division NC10 bacterium]